MLKFRAENIDSVRGTTKRTSSTQPAREYSAGSGIDYPAHRLKDNGVMVARRVKHHLGIEFRANTRAPLINLN